MSSIADTWPMARRPRSKQTPTERRRSSVRPGRGVKLSGAHRAGAIAANPEMAANVSAPGTVTGTSAQVEGAARGSCTSAGGNPSAEGPTPPLPTDVMSEGISRGVAMHPDQFAIHTELVHRLLRRQLPQHVDLPLRAVVPGGTVNAVFAISGPT